MPGTANGYHENAKSTFQIYHDAKTWYAGPNGLSRLYETAAGSGMMINGNGLRYALPRQDAPRILDRHQVEFILGNAQSAQPLEKRGEDMAVAYPSKGCQIRTVTTVA